ncbi:MAG TPA: hypothetical protein VFY40_08515 [Blastocatellia bacterium]|nr:hypothetical protein [Blastocatellia bacterium]
MPFGFNKSLLLVWVCIAACSTATIAQCKITLKIGARLSVKCLPTEDEDHPRIATAPAQSRPFIERVVGGVKYIVAFDEETHRIKFIHTVDRAFRTKNGLRVGYQIRVSRKQITGGCCGWYTLAGQTLDGWDIIIARKNILDDEGLNDWKEGEIRTVTIGAFIKGGN